MEENKSLHYQFLLQILHIRKQDILGTIAQLIKQQGTAFFHIQQRQKRIISLYYQFLL